MAIPPPPRQPSPRARELIFRYQGTQKALLWMGTLFVLMGSGFTTVFCWGVPADLAIAATTEPHAARILDAHVDRSVSSNHRHPTVIRFAYTVNGTRYEAQSHAWDRGVIAAAQPGETLPVEVSGLNPQWARIAGSTRAPFGYGAGFVLVFPLIGLLMAGWAIRSNRREIRAFTRGTPVKARRTYAGPDTTTRINGRNPVVVRWEFRVDETIYSGSIGSMSLLALEDLAKQEEPVVLYDPDDPSVNTVWVD